jgi:alpha-D-xyloside xylohydrolase
LLGSNQAVMLSWRELESKAKGTGMPVCIRRSGVAFVSAVFVLGLLRAIPPGRGQEPASDESVHMPRRVVSFEHVNQEMILKCDVGRLVIRPYADSVIHVSYFPGSIKSDLPLWGLDAAPPAPKYRVESTTTSLKLATSQLAVSIDRKTAQMTFLDPKQNVLLSSTKYYLKEAAAAGKATFHAHAEFQAPEDESYYGLGQHQDGWMDLRGKTISLWRASQQGKDANVAIPILVTNHRYALVFDNPSKTTVAPGGNGLTAWDAEAGNALSYFVIYGNTIEDLYRGYRLLTGTTPMPPRSALGFIQGNPSYLTQDGLLQAARNHREKGYAGDMLVIHQAGMELDEKSWPDPGAMNAALKKLGYEVLISCRPNIVKGSSRFDALASMGCLVKNKDGQTLLNSMSGADSALVDTTKPPCATWFGNMIQESYASKGFHGWWLNESEQDTPALVLALQGGTSAEALNFYPSLQTKAVYEGHRQNLKNRCFILSGTAYLGAQRYGASLRSTHPASDWEELRQQVPLGLNVAASGLAYWSSNIGGSGSGGAGSDDSELLVRIFEFGAFCPTFRAEGSTPGKDLWSYREPVEKALVKYLQLRYRLLPYIYSLAHSVTESGAPFMRALFMDFPQDPEARDIKDEYMFGPAFLVAPVVERGKVTREVYLPKGTAWYDYWTGKKYQGGQRVSADAALDVLPLFVRAGSIIPIGNGIISTKADQKEVELTVYAGVDARFDLYQDDGTTYDYEKGKFSLAQIRWNEATQQITITGDHRGLFSHPQSTWLKVIR